MQFMNEEARNNSMLPPKIPRVMMHKKNSDAQILPQLRQRMKQQSGGGGFIPFPISHLNNPHQSSQNLMFQSQKSRNDLAGEVTFQGNAGNSSNQTNKEINLTRTVQPTFPIPVSIPNQQDPKMTKFMTADTSLEGIQQI